MDCLDCKHCKINQSKLILRCRTNHWKKDDGTEKIIRLTNTEAESLRIRWRDLFRMGRKCCDAESMLT